MNMMYTHIIKEKADKFCYNNILEIIKSIHFYGSIH